jgi:hypothetical protein
VWAIPVLTDKACLQRSTSRKRPGFLPTSEKKLLAEKVLAAWKRAMPTFFI